MNAPSLTVNSCTDTAELAARNIGVEFGGVLALSNIDITVRRGKTLGLIGPNGAGKTTLVNVLSGFQAPKVGSLSLAERDITRYPPHRMARSGVVRTFQSIKTFPMMPVRENLLAASLRYGARRGPTAKHAMDLLARFGLADKAESLAASLSHGEERKLGIARALALQPQFLLLDEPAAGLNDEEGKELVTILRAVQSDFGCGLLLIEHSMQVVMDISDEVHVLDRGRTIALGSPAEIRSNSAVIAAYLGSGV